MNIKIKYKIFILFFLISNYAFSKQILIKDVLNREVIVKQPIKKVIALGTSLSFITYLQARDKVVGVEAIELKDIKKRTYTYVNRDWAKKQPIVGQGGKSKRPNLEAIKVLNPDVIFTITQDRREAELLSQQLNIPVVVVGYGLETIDFEHIYHSLEIMGKILGKEKRANSLVLYIQNLQKEFKKVHTPKKAYIGAIAHKGLQGITSTQGDFMPFQLAHISNVVSELQEKKKFFIDKEYLLIKNPPIIFIDQAGLELVKEQFNQDKKYFQRLEAFLDKTFITLSNTFYYINLDQMLANSFFMAKQVYPEHYQDLDPAKKADEIFQNFVGAPLYEMIKEDIGGFQQLKVKDNRFYIKSIH